MRSWPCMRHHSHTGERRPPVTRNGTSGNIIFLIRHHTASISNEFQSRPGVSTVLLRCSSPLHLTPTPRLAERLASLIIHETTTVERPAGSEPHYTHYATALRLLETTAHTTVSGSSAASPTSPPPPAHCYHQACTRIAAKYNEMGIICTVLMRKHTVCAMYAKQTHVHSDVKQCLVLAPTPAARNLALQQFHIDTTCSRR